MQNQQQDSRFDEVLVQSILDRIEEITGVNAHELAYAWGVRERMCRDESRSLEYN